MSRKENTTIGYYNEQKDQFIHSTLHVDMGVHYEKFLGHLAKGAAILDAGCGPGRDVKYFLSQGYAVSAFDGAKEMVRFAQEYTGIDIAHEEFLTYEAIDRVQGIWACATLLHLSYEEQKEVLKKYQRFLTEEGIFYMSFKYGQGSYKKDGRVFYRHQEESFATLVEEVGGYEILEQYISGDVRVNRAEEKWLNVLLRTVKGV